MKYFSPFLFVLLIACGRESRNVAPSLGYAPIYGSATSRVVSYSSAEPTKFPGKIYAYNNYAFQVEQGKGIHIINNTNPQQAAKIGFINVAGCTEISIKANYLYTNNVNDLVVINISNISSPFVVNRQQNAFPAIDQTFPPFDGVVFECPDPSKGIVIGWEQKTIQNPNCRR